MPVNDLLAGRIFIEYLLSGNLQSDFSKTAEPAASIVHVIRQVCTKKSIDW